MPRKTDCLITTEIANTIEAILAAFPTMPMFEGFDLTQVRTIITQGKKAKDPLKVAKVYRNSYPRYIFDSYLYIIEVMEANWNEMNQKQKNLAIFNALCAIPQNAFVEQSENYAKLRRPDYSVFYEAYCAAGGVLDWIEDPKARDPLEVAKEKQTETGEDGITRLPVLASDIGDVTLKVATP